MCTHARTVTCVHTDTACSFVGAFVFEARESHTHIHTKVVHVQLRSGRLAEIRSSSLLPYCPPLSPSSSRTYVHHWLPFLHTIALSSELASKSSSCDCQALPAGGKGLPTWYLFSCTFCSNHDRVRRSRKASNCHLPSHWRRSSTCAYVSLRQLAACVCVSQRQTWQCQEGQASQSVT